VVVGAATQWPAIQPIFFFDGKIINAGVANSREPCVIELPILVAIRSKPLAGRVVRLVGEADGNPVPTKSPELLDEPVVQLRRPFPGKEGYDFFASMQELRAVPPITVDGITACDALWVTGMSRCPGFWRSPYKRRFRGAAFR
jgi:hypothetical protein